MSNVDIEYKRNDLMVVDHYQLSMDEKEIKNMHRKRWSGTNRRLPVS